MRVLRRPTSPPVVTLAVSFERPRSATRLRLASVLEKLSIGPVSQPRKDALLRVLPRAPRKPKPEQEEKHV